MVLVSGYTAPAATWGLQRQAFSPTHRVVAMDRRAHGDSEAPPHGHRMARHAADLRELFVHLDVDGAVVVGSSMGSNVIWSYVDLFGTDRVRAIVAVDQTPKMINEGDWTLGLYNLTWDNLESFVHDFPLSLGRHGPPGTPVPELSPELAALREQVRQTYPFDLTIPLLRDHSSADWRDVVVRCDVPVLAVGGKNSPVWPMESSVWIGDNAPEGRSVVIDDAGHAPFLESPQAFNDALLAFLDEVV